MSQENTPLPQDTFDDGDADAPIELPIDGVLDLHHFLPREVPDLLVTYLDACRERGIRDVRIIHGKGTGALRRTVHAALERHPAVRNFQSADATAGGWGATLVTLWSEPDGEREPDRR
ncbi:MAG: Smr/MutS family protein [Myxococcales bacterium]|nr:Smr/MutS family protein [Myxococcales bacterium]